jgi:hypothetical protein
MRAYRVFAWSLTAIGPLGADAAAAMLVVGMQVTAPLLARASAGLSPGVSQIRGDHGSRHGLIFPRVSETTSHTRNETERWPERQLGPAL